MVWGRLIHSLLCFMQWMKGRRRKSHHYLWYGKIFSLCSKLKRLWKEKETQGEKKKKKNQRIPRQILFTKAKLCHFTSFGPNIPSKAVQGPVPHRHLLAGFEDPVLEESGCGQALAGTHQDLQPCAKAGAWLLPVTVCCWEGWESQSISSTRSPLSFNCALTFPHQCDVCIGSKTPLALCSTWCFKPEPGLG